ncbi:hypothetical protein SCAR479_04108 [Seiridium cardinale]|uniref:Uncharacterized protein n=1 Tax=Seiridium cardinale TaxID=138064 RepID=A0ABR2XYN2_9PEZI
MAQTLFVTLLALAASILARTVLHAGLGVVSAGMAVNGFAAQARSKSTLRRGNTTELSQGVPEMAVWIILGMMFGGAFLIFIAMRIHAFCCGRRSPTANRSLYRTSTKYDRATLPMGEIDITGGNYPSAPEAVCSVITELSTELTAARRINSALSRTPGSSTALVSTPVPVPALMTNTTTVLNATGGPAGAGPAASYTVPRAGDTSATPAYDPTQGSSWSTAAVAVDSIWVEAVRRRFRWRLLSPNLLPRVSREHITNTGFLDEAHLI